MSFPDPDRESISRFASALFLRADSGGFVSIRAFLDNADGVFAPQAWSGVPVVDFDAVVDAAYRLARRAAAAHEKVVFCPPIATFRSPSSAAEADLANGLALVIECDRTPRRAVADLTDLLGPPTIVVASGGVYSDPNTGALEEKLHAYWRLTHPTRDPEEHAILAEARRLAAAYVGADPTSGPICHPIRWAGSWHRKAEPRLARITFESENEIDLVQALAALRSSIPSRQEEEDPDAPPPPIADVRSALLAIPNADLDWDEWNNIGMALFRATSGVEEGLALFDSFSARSEKYDRSRVVERWRHYWRSPPTRTGAAKLFAAALLANPGWRRPSSPINDRRPTDFKSHNGKILANDLVNVRLGLAKLNVSLSYNSFADRVLFVNGEDSGTVEDEDVDHFWFKFEQILPFTPTEGYFRRAVVEIARERRFNPVTDYLSSLVWDQTPRIDTWLIDYAHARDDSYVRAVSGLILVAAVARAYDPGRKFDEMLVLESPQGTEKSTALGVLAVRDEWFTDSLHLGVRDKEALEQLDGKWIIEAADLSGMRRSDVETLKAFLSRQTDRARKAYGRLPTERPRTCVFFGTTNSSRYLRDEQNRRFWPVKVLRFDIPGLRRVRDQLWAEAKHRYGAGESIRLDPSLYALAEFEQDARRIDDQWVDDLISHFGDKKGRVRTSDIFNVLGLQNAVNRGQVENQRIGEAMRQLGWDREKQRIDHGFPGRWCYVRGSTEAERSRTIYVFPAVPYLGVKALVSYSPTRDESNDPPF